MLKTACNSTFVLVLHHLSMNIMWLVEDRCVITFLNDSNHIHLIINVSEKNLILAYTEPYLQRHVQHLFTCASEKHRNQVILPFGLVPPVAQK